MPDWGITPPPPERPATHVSTQEWQSFEVRMRRRRVERCLVRAEVALESGFEEDARAALDEARRLDPQVPDFDTLCDTVLSRHREEAEEKRKAADLQTAAGRRRLAAYAAVILLTVGVGSAAILMFDRGGMGSGTASTESGQAAGVQASASPAGTVASTPPPDAGPAAPQTSLDSVHVATQVVSAQATVPIAQPISDRREVPQEQPRTIAPPLPAVATPTTQLVRAPLPRVTDTVPALGRTDGAPAPPVLASSGVAELPGAPTPPATPPPPAPAPAALGESGVRAVLAQYEAAYSSLNASAAQVVWPGVDRRSLARAFDSLSSQSVSLGRCNVTLTGVTARANCDGSATWTPKVGGGRRTESRHWRFELANSSGTWQIVKAEAR